MKKVPSSSNAQHPNFSTCFSVSTHCRKTNEFNPINDASYELWSDGWVCSSKQKELINIQELILLLNLTIMYAESFQGSGSVFSTVKNVMISLILFAQLCSIISSPTHVTVMLSENFKL